MGAHPGKKNSVSPHNQKLVIRNSLLNLNFEQYMEITLLYKENLDALIDSFKCYICMTNYITKAPTCGHMGICNKCYSNENFNYRKKCAICKKNIQYINLILPFSEHNTKINNSKLIEICQDFNINNIKNQNIKNKVINIKNDINIFTHLNEESKKIKKDNYILNIEYNKLLRLNTILKNKVNIQTKNHIKLNINPTKIIDIKNKNKYKIEKHLISQDI